MKALISVLALVSASSLPFTAAAAEPGDVITIPAGQLFCMNYPRREPCFGHPGNCPIVPGSNAKVEAVIVIDNIIGFVGFVGSTTCDELKLKPVSLSATNAIVTEKKSVLKPGHVENILTIRIEGTNVDLNGPQ